MSWKLPVDKNINTRLALTEAVAHLSPVEAATEVSGVLSYLLARVAKTGGTSKANAVMEHCFKFILLNQKRGT